MSTEDLEGKLQWYRQEIQRLEAALEAETVLASEAGEEKSERDNVIISTGPQSPSNGSSEEAEGPAQEQHPADDRNHQAKEARYTKENRLAPAPPTGHDNSDKPNPRNNGFHINSPAFVPMFHEEDHHHHQNQQHEEAPTTSEASSVDGDNGTQNNNNNNNINNTPASPRHAFQNNNTSAPTAQQRVSIVWRWPRTCSCLMGVVLPLLGLIGYSILFGIAVAQFEAPYEIVANDLKLQQQANTQQMVKVVHLTSTVTPKACLQVFLNNQTATPQEAETFLLQALVAVGENFTEAQARMEEDTKAALQALSIQQQRNTTALLSTDDSNVFVDLYDFMRTCGVHVDGIVRHAVAGIVQAAHQAGPPTFQWIRCVPGNNGIAQQTRTPHMSETTKSRHLLNQTAFVKDIWTTDQLRWRQAYLEEFQQEGASLEDAIVASWQLSIEAATSGTGCELNSAAAGKYCVL